MIKGIKVVLFLVFLPFLFFAHEFNPAHLVVKEVDKIPMRQNGCIQ